MRLASETIFSGKSHVIPMIEVSHVERDARPDWKGAITVVMKHSQWQDEYQQWSPSVWMPAEEASRFLEAWCHLRSEIAIR
jgi:hypothetical protein